MPSTSGTIESGLRDWERTAEKAKNPESFASTNSSQVADGIIETRQNIMRGAPAEGVRQGFQQSDTDRSPSELKKIQEGSGNNGNGTETVAFFQPGSAVMALSLQSIDNQVPPPLTAQLLKPGNPPQSIINAIRRDTANRVTDTLNHERIHERIEDQAKRNHQNGLINHFLGVELYTDLHEWAASRGKTDGTGHSSQKDTYDQRRARAKDFIRHIDMSENQAYGLLVGETPEGSPTKANHLVIVRAFLTAKGKRR